MPDTHHPFSPSTLQRLSLCPGSYRMQKDIPEPAKSSDAIEGTMLHDAIATGNDINLNDEQLMFVELCNKFIVALLRDDDIVVMKEKHLEVKSDGDILTCGTADVVIIHGDRTADVIDWKFGRNPAPDAHNNYQLAAYALGVFQEYDLESVTVHIYQPRLYVHTSYTFRDPVSILHNIKFIIDRAKREETLTLCASEQACRYCRAASTCPACNARYGLVPADVQQNMLEDPAKLLDLWERSQMALKLVEAIKEKVTDYINEHGSLGCWTIEQRQGRKEIPNASLVYDRVKDFLTGRELSECYSIKVTALLDKVAEKLVVIAEQNGEKLTKKDAKFKAEELLAGLIVRGKGAAVLTKGARK